MKKGQIFNQIQVKKPNRNTFDMSHDLKLSCKMGDLVPIFNEPVMPGDKWQLNAESLLRFAPMVAPVMHRFDQRIEYFFVPYRLLWDNWENYITNTKLETTGQLPSFPTYDVVSGTHGKLLDYMGIPPLIGSESESISALPLSAYQMIYNEYYRNPWDDSAKVDFKCNDGSQLNFNRLRLLRKRAWMHDYFTSALPYAQKGDPVVIPVEGTVTLKPDWDDNAAAKPKFIDEAGNIDTGAVNQDGSGPEINIGSSTNRAAYDPFGTLEVQNATSTINDLRRAYSLQTWLELAARAGSRMVENLKAFFNVKPRDERFQRPEYITGLKTPVTISEVLNTTGTAERPQGDMAGHGVSVVNGRGGSFYAPEWGIIIGVMSVLPVTAYQQGIARHWLMTQDPFQFPWPQFAHIGEQEVLNKEIYAFQGANGNDTFGYLPRYAEWKYANNRVAGDFRSSLNFWQAGRIFATPPALNSDFITAECQSINERIFAVTDSETDNLWCHVLNKCTVNRMLPIFGTPSTM